MYKKYNNSKYNSNHVSVKKYSVKTIKNSQNPQNGHSADPPKLDIFDFPINVLFCFCAGDF